MRLTRAFAALAGAVLLAACSNKDAVQDITGVDPGARVKFFNFAINAPSVNFYANDAKVTAIGSATCQSAKVPPVTATDSLCLSQGVESTLGVAYGSAGNGAFYSALAPGQYSLTGRISAATDKNLPIASASTTVAPGSYYSFYMSGIYDAAAKKSDAFVVEDKFPATVDYSKALIRFVNASHNSQPLVLTLTNTTLGVTDLQGSPAVAYKGAGPFLPLTPGTWDLTARIATPTGTALVTRTAVGFNGGRVYTITLRGDATVSSTGTATNRPFLDNTINR